MKRNALVIALAGIAVAVAAWQLVPAGTHDLADPDPTNAPGVAVSNAPPAAPATAAPVGAQGYVVHFDKNGNIIDSDVPMTDAEFSAALEQSIDTSQDGLVSVNSPVPGGGVMVDLQGRFQNASVATVDANGKVVAPCLGNESEAKAFTSSTAAKNAAAKD